MGEFVNMGTLSHDTGLHSLARTLEGDSSSCWNDLSFFFFWNDLESWMNVMAHMKCNKYVRTLLQTMEEGIRRLGEVGMLKWTII